MGLDNFITTTAVLVCIIFSGSCSEVTPQNASVLPTNSTSITCEVSGSLLSARYTLTWFKNDVAITATANKYVIHSSNNTLEISNIDFTTDIGPYVCSFVLDNSQVINETVYVYGQAFVKSFDKSKNLVEDDALNLTCKAEGYPTPTVTWFKDGQVLNNTTDRVSFTNYGDVINASVKITKMQFEDAGEYSCEAINEIQGQQYNASATITVRVKDKLAALWPFLGICVEVTVLCIIIFIYERHRQKKLAEEDAKEEAGHLTNSHANRDDVRQRKV